MAAAFGTDMSGRASGGNGRSAVASPNLSATAENFSLDGGAKAAICGTRAKPSFLIACRIELFEEGPKILGLGFVFDAGEDHFRA